MSRNKRKLSLELLVWCSPQKTSKMTKISKIVVVPDFNCLIFQITRLILELFIFRVTLGYPCPLWLMPTVICNYPLSSNPKHQMAFYFWQEKLEIWLVILGPIAPRWPCRTKVKKLYTITIVFPITQAICNRCCTTKKVVAKCIF